MEVLQRDPECSRPDEGNVLESASAATACQPLSCPNHEGKVSRKDSSTPHVHHSGRDFSLKDLFWKKRFTPVALYCTTCRWWSFTASHVKQPCAWNAPRASTGSMWRFLWGTCWSSTSRRSKLSWTLCATGTSENPDSGVKNKGWRGFRNFWGSHSATLTLQNSVEREPRKIIKKNKKLSPPCRLPQLTAAIDLVNEISKQLTERKSQAVSEISCTFDELEKALHQRKTALITEVENICTSKQKVRRGTGMSFGWQTLSTRSFLFYFFRLFRADEGVI